MIQHVHMKESLKEQRNAAIVVPMLSRVYTGTLNIQLGPFKRYIAITLIIIYLYLGKGLDILNIWLTATSSTVLRSQASLAGLELSQLWFANELDLAKTSQELT